MTKKELKLLLIFVIVFVIICCIVYFNRNNNKENNDNVTNTNNYVDILTDKTIYFSVKKHIEDLIINVNESENELVYNVLDINYINSNNINVDNVIDKVNIFNKMRNYLSEEMYLSSNDNNATVYSSGIVYSNSSSGNKFYTITRIDYNNNTYSIEIITENKYNIFKELVKLETNEYEINNNSDINTYNSLNASDLDVCSLYLSIYKYNAKYDVTKLYEQLNDNYKKDYYSTIDKYRTYITDNLSLINESYLKQYKKVTTNTGNQYTCVDNNNIKYVFDEILLLNYTIVIE